MDESMDNVEFIQGMVKDLMDKWSMDSAKVADVARGISSHLTKNEEDPNAIAYCTAIALTVFLQLFEYVKLKAAEAEKAGN